MYTLYTAIEYKNSAGDLDYESLIGIPVPTQDIEDIKAAMFIMDVKIYKIESDNKVVYESVALRKITHRRSVRRWG